jgi:hypothetical protein
MIDCWISFAVGELPFAFESSALPSVLLRGLFFGGVGLLIVDCWIVRLLDSLRGCLRRCWIVGL